jgi:hypothetical protein
MKELSYFNTLDIAYSVINSFIILKHIIFSSITKSNLVNIVISRKKCPCFGSGGCPFSVDMIKV